MEEFDLTGRTALVTGAGRGIRLEIARQLTRNGARLIAHEANRASADSAGQELPEAIWVVRDGLFVQSPYAIEDGYARVTDAPGWGVEINPDWLARSSYQISDLS